jgi:hypothetical protein
MASYDPYSGEDRGSERLANWTNPLETIELTDQYALREFCETGRKFSRYLSVLTGVAAAELEEGMKAMAQGSGKAWAMGLDTRRMVRRTIKHLEGAAEGFEGAAAQFLATWLAFQKDFAELLEGDGSKPKKAGFEIV